MFLNKIKTFVLNEVEEEKIEQFSKTLKSTANGYQDVEFALKLII